MISDDRKVKTVKVYIIEYWNIVCDDETPERQLEDVALNRSFGKHEYDIGMGKVELLRAGVAKEEEEKKEDESTE